MEKVGTMSETNILNPNLTESAFGIESNVGFPRLGIQPYRPGGDGHSSDLPDGSASSEVVARRLMRYLSLLDLFQTLNRSVKLPELFMSLSQNLTGLFHFQVFGILWLDGDRLQLNLYPAVPVNETFIADTIATLLQAHSDAQTSPPSVHILDCNPLAGQPKPAAAKVNSHLTVPLISSGKALGAVTLCKMDQAAYSDEDAQIFGMLVGYLATALENALLFQRIEELAMTDGLTRLCNHAHFYQVLDTEIMRAHRYTDPLALILLDVDDFKAVNDTYGHQAGDTILQELAAIIRAVIRQVDIAARYGGDEFAILMPQADLAGAVTLAARLQHRVADHLFAIGATSIHITLSLGVSSLSEQIKYKESLVGEADIALYRAKHEKKQKISARPRSDASSSLEHQAAFSYAT